MPLRPESATMSEPRDSGRRHQARVLRLVLTVPSPFELKRASDRYCSRPIPQGLKMILSRCEIHRGCTIEVFFGEIAGGRIPWPDPDLKPDAERDFPGSVPIRLAHLPKDRNAKARRAISTLTAEVAELQEENKKLDQLVAAGFRHDELSQALQEVPHPSKVSLADVMTGPIANGYSTTRLRGVVPASIGRRSKRGNGPSLLGSERQTDATRRRGCDEHDPAVIRDPRSLERSSRLPVGDVQHHHRLILTHVLGHILDRRCIPRP